MIRQLFIRLVSIYRHSTVPQVFVLLMDIASAIGVFFVVELFQTHNGIWNPHDIFSKMVVMLVLSTVGFLLAGSYRTIMRHLGVTDVLRILMACVIPMSAMVVLRWINNRQLMVDLTFAFSYRETIEMYTILPAVMVFSRFAGQYVYNEFVRHRRPTANILIYGAGAAGVVAYNALRQDYRVEYHVSAFVDDDPSKINQRLNGITIMSRKSAFDETFLHKRDITMVVIAIPSIRFIYKQAIINKALELGLQVKVVPHISSWINGEFSSNQMEDIKIEDLLGRNGDRTESTRVAHEVTDKVVLVTGAAGALGSELCRQLIHYRPARLVMVDNAEYPMEVLHRELYHTEPYCHWSDHMVFQMVDILDARRMRELFVQYRPQLVYHTAAYTRMSIMDYNAYAAARVNILGTRTVADLAIQYSADTFVMLSSDESVNPSSVVGLTQRMAESYIQSRPSEHTRMITTRFGHVLGSKGSVVSIFKKQIAQGGPLTVTHRDVMRYFITIPEACSLVLESSVRGINGDVFVFDMGHPVKIYDLAKKMIQLSQRSDIEIREVGLRPGEKLTEEQVTTKENTSATDHSKIFRALTKPADTAEVDAAIEEIARTVETMDNGAIVSKMKELLRL